MEIVNDIEKSFSILESYMNDHYHEHPLVTLGPLDRPIDSVPPLDPTTKTVNRSVAWFGPRNVDSSLD
ncbi:13698_t:CDS:2 [Acaulospora colombiana]|uniref:13698_t:CDS:1 n=1 Tax=Acaulospora colombiana TaxID=27376 RepID=A0ACA9K254_9GLOM|nr:13698_t:CDS:2 [Acaulospora colombiana]